MMNIRRGGGSMKDTNNRFFVTQEQNELGTIWIERIIEKLIFQEIEISITEQVKIINSRQIRKEDKDVKFNEQE